MAKGKFIVIEGTDGSGKTTQTKMLADRLMGAGYQVAMFDFPQYFKTSSDFIKAYLQGRYGSIKEVGPQKASLMYAMDRFEAAADIRRAIADGKIALANRYVASNLGHQGAKIKSEDERMKFFLWVQELEYKILEIPKPDLNVVLHIPAEVAQQMVDRKSANQREYANGAKRDLHESSLSHLKQAEKVYLEIARLFPRQFTLLECYQNKHVVEAQQINDQIAELIKRKLGLKIEV
jgi:dTMP kinase